MVKFCGLERSFLIILQDTIIQFISFYYFIVVHMGKKGWVGFYSLYELLKPTFFELLTFRWCVTFFPLYVIYITGVEILSVETIQICPSGHRT